MRRGIQEWKSRLEALLATANDRPAGVVLKDICALAAEMGDEEAELLLETFPHLLELARPFAEANMQRVEDQTAAEAQRLLERPFDGPVSFAEIASAHSLMLYSRPGQMIDDVDFGDCQRLVMIGCGRIPFTNFLLHDKTDVPEIVGIDILPEAVDTVNRLAARLGYTRMRAELADGRTYDYGQAEIVFVSSYVPGRSAILSRIADTAPENVQIVAREPYSLARLWLESSVPDPRLEVVSRGPGSNQLSRGLYLKRRR